MLSETGRLVFSYADEMFRLSNELQDRLQGRPLREGIVFHVGIAMVAPKLLAYRVLEPVTHMAEKVRLASTRRIDNHLFCRRQACRTLQKELS